MAKIFTKFLKGSEAKFSLEIKADGFSMDTDDFEVEISTPGTSVKGYKNPEPGTPTDVIIYREPELSDNSLSGDSSSSSSEPEPQGTWFVIVDTKSLNIGDIKVITTAHIPDAAANDGIRDDIAVTSLGNLANP